MNRIIRILSIIYVILFYSIHTAVYVMLIYSGITTSESIKLLKISAGLCNFTFLLIAAGTIYLVYCIKRNYQFDTSVTIAFQIILGISCVILSIPLGVILG